MPRTSAEAVGAVPTAQVALAVIVSASMRDSRGRPEVQPGVGDPDRALGARAFTVALASATSAPGR